MGLLSKLRTYQGKWNVVNSTKFDADEANSVSSAEVVASQYGKSVCLHMVNGGSKFIPMSNTGRDLPVGSSVDVKNTNIVELHRDGDENIYRIEIL